MKNNTNEEFETKQIKTNSGKVRLFKMAPRMEAKHRLCVVSETGLEGPVVKVIGALYKGTSPYNKGKQVARFYDPETKYAYVKWVADDDLILAISKDAKNIIYVTGEESKIKNKDTGATESYFKIYGTEVSEEIAD